MNKCKYCGKSIGSDKRTDARFCSGTCKTRYHEHRRSNGFSVAPKSERLAKKNPIPDNATGLSGTFIPPLIPKDTEQAPKQQAAPERPALEPPRNTIIIVDNDGKTQVQKSFEPKEYLPLPLPAQTIVVTRSEFNPEYLRALKFCLDQNKVCDGYKTKMEEIVKQIKEVKNYDGTGYVAGGATLGLAAGAVVTNNQKQKPSDNNTWLKGAFVGSAIGSGLGWMLYQINKEQIEAEKAKAIVELNQRWHRYKKGYDIQMAEIKRVEAYYKTLNKTIENKQVVENPDYIKAKQDNEQAEAEYKKYREQSLSGTDPLENFDPNSKIRPATSVAQQRDPLLDFQEPWLSFIHRPALNFFCAIHGLSGAGKSHLVMQWAKYLAQNHGRVLYISSEEGFSPTMTKKINDLAAGVKGLSIGALNSANEIFTTVENKFHFIILDSVNNLRIDPATMKALRQKFSQSAIIAVCQSTKNDQIRGSYEIVHDADIIIKVAAGKATTTKNRYGSDQKEFEVFAVLNEKNKQSAKIIPYNRKKKTNRDSDDEISNNL